MKIKIKVNKSKSKNNLFTAGNCHSKQKKVKLVCSRPRTAIITWGASFAKSEKFTFRNFSYFQLS